MTDVDTGQVSASAADVYESFFVPALFAQWTDRVLDFAEVVPGERVLDVGCGSGVLTRAARERVGTSGSVVGLDPNEGMLAVARRSGAGEWEVGMAEDLPFGDGSFDRVVSQFALMFTDPEAALSEMARVTRPTGRVAVAVWDSLEHNPGYAALGSLVDRLFGPAAADAIRAPFALGESGLLGNVIATALADPAITSEKGVARFDSLSAWLHTEVRGWTLADMIDDEGFDVLVREADRELSTFVDHGRVAFPATALIARGVPSK